MRIQALINIAALYPLTGSFLAQFLMTYPDAYMYIGSAGLVVAVVLQTLEDCKNAFNATKRSAAFARINTEDRFAVLREPPHYPHARTGRLS